MLNTYSRNLNIVWCQWKLNGLLSPLDDDIFSTRQNPLSIASNQVQKQSMLSAKIGIMRIFCCLCEDATMNLFLWCECFTPLSHSLCVEQREGVEGWHRTNSNHTAFLSMAVMVQRQTGWSLSNFNDALKDKKTACLRCCLICLCTTLMILFIIIVGSVFGHK